MFGFGYKVIVLDSGASGVIIPHGRPTVTEITVDELEKRFHRK